MLHFALSLCIVSGSNLSLSLSLSVRVRRLHLFQYTEGLDCYKYLNTHLTEVVVL